MYWDLNNLDLKISELRRTSNMSGFLLEPNLVQHIGYSSSLGEEHQKVACSLIELYRQLLINREGTMAIWENFK